MSYAKLNEEESILLIKNHVSERQILRTIASIENPIERKNYIENLLKQYPNESSSDSAITEKLQKNIIRSTNILSLYLKSGELEVKHKPFGKLKSSEKQNLVNKLKEILNNLENC